MEYVNDNDLKRYALIDWLDSIFWDSDDSTECFSFMHSFGDEYFKGVYDYLENKYVSEVTQ